MQAPRETHGRLEQAISDAENLKKLAFQESVKRWKAEEDAVDAKRKVFLSYIIIFLFLYIYDIPTMK